MNVWPRRGAGEGKNSRPTQRRRGCGTRWQDSIKAPRSFARSSTGKGQRCTQSSGHAERGRVWTYTTVGIKAVPVWRVGAPAPMTSGRWSHVACQHIRFKRLLVSGRRPSRRRLPRRTYDTALRTVQALDACTCRKANGAKNVRHSFGVERAACFTREVFGPVRRERVVCVVPVDGHGRDRGHDRRRDRGHGQRARARRVVRVSVPACCAPVSRTRAPALQ